jgi:hypothetical protein
MTPRRGVCLIDNDVISELRRRDKANPGVVAFVKEVASSDAPLYVAAVTIGEVRRGIDVIRHQGDVKLRNSAVTAARAVCHATWRALAGEGSRPTSYWTSTAR